MPESAPIYLEDVDCDEAPGCPLAGTGAHKEYQHPSYPQAAERPQ